MPQNNVMAEDGGGASPPPSQPDEEQQTIPLPLAAFPAPPKPGMMVQLKVISIDQNNQVVNAVVSPPDNAPDGAGGSDSLAQEFNRQPS